jgi:hypothetical protein
VTAPVGAFKILNFKYNIFMNIKESILKTLAWFELFEHPLTSEELFKFLWMSPNLSYQNFLEELKKIVSEKVVEEKDGFYFLPSKNELIGKRLEKKKWIDKKNKILKRAVKKMRYVPFLKAVFVCNNLSFKTASENSDIDVFIVAREGRIWIVRFFTTIFLNIFFLRRHGNKIKDRICLSFYCSDKYLNLRDIQISNRPDIYLIYWLSQLTLIYDVDDVVVKLERANNWIKEYVSNSLIENSDKDLLVEGNKFSKSFKGFFEKAWKSSYGDLVEKQLSEMQKVKMKMNLYSKQNENNANVIINDKMLKFHENDRRVYYQKK